MILRRKLGGKFKNVFKSMINATSLKFPIKATMKILINTFEISKKKILKNRVAYS